MKLKFLFNDDQSSWIENLPLASALSLFPLLYLTLKGWTNTLTFVLLAISVFHFLRQSRSSWTIKNISSSEWLVILSLSSGFLAILISQVLRQDMTFKPYDGALRMLVSAPVFLLLIRKKVDFVKVFQYVCPLSLLILIVFVHLYPMPESPWGGRLGTYFVDPNTIGIYTMLLAFLCLFSIDAISKDNMALRFLKYAGFMAGVYLELKAQTRGAWIAEPAMLALWAGIHWGSKSKAIIFVSTLMTILVILGLYFFVDAFHVRVNSIYIELIAWINGTNTDTSIGLRLSFWQMSWILFKQSPFYGYGDLGYQSQLLMPQIQSVFSQDAIIQMGHIGSHSEYLANMVRSGIFGLLAVLFEFCLPGLIFIQGLNSPIRAIKGTSAMGLCLVLGMMITAISLEVLTLKYTNSFYGLMIASLCASVLWVRPNENIE